MFAISAHAPAFESVESVMVMDGASKVLMCAWKESESVASFRTSSGREVELDVALRWRHGAVDESCRRAS